MSSNCRRTNSATKTIAVNDKTWSEARETQQNPSNDRFVPRADSGGKKTTTNTKNRKRNRRKCRRIVAEKIQRRKRLSRRRNPTESAKNTTKPKLESLRVPIRFRCQKINNKCKKSNVKRRRNVVEQIRRRKQLFETSKSGQNREGHNETQAATGSRLRSTLTLKINNKRQKNRVFKRGGGGRERNRRGGLRRGFEGRNWGEEMRRRIKERNWGELRGN